MINHEDNPEYLNSFLDYTMTILNKSPNTVKEYNYDLATFLKFIKIRFNLTQEDDFSLITIKDIPLKIIDTAGIRRKSKVYCPNCKSETNLNDIYCKECGTCLESISKRTYDFSIKNILSNINIKDSFKVAGFATVILFFISVIVKQILGSVLGEYTSYISASDILLLLNGGDLCVFTSGSGMMSYGSYYNFSFQLCSLILLALPVICLGISYKVVMKEKNTNELILFIQVGFYGI